MQAIRKCAIDIRIPLSISPNHLFWSKMDKISLLFLTSLVTFVSGYTCWPDQSCQYRPDFGRGFVSAIGLAEAGRRRLHDDGDTYQAEVFEVLFKTSKTENENNATGGVDSMQRRL